MEFGDEVTEMIWSTELRAELESLLYRASYSYRESTRRPEVSVTISHSIYDSPYIQQFAVVVVLLETPKPKPWASALRPQVSISRVGFRCRVRFW